MHDTIQKRINELEKFVSTARENAFRALADWDFTKVREEIEFIERTRIQRLELQNLLAKEEENV